MRLLALVFLLIYVPSIHSSALRPRRQFDSFLECEGSIPRTIISAALRNYPYPSLNSFCSAVTGHPSFGLYCESPAGSPRWRVSFSDPFLATKRIWRYCQRHCWCQYGLRYPERVNGPAPEQLFSPWTSTADQPIARLCTDPFSSPLSVCISPKRPPVNRLFPSQISLFHPQVLHPRKRSLHSLRARTIVPRKEFTNYIVCRGRFPPFLPPELSGTHWVTLRNFCSSLTGFPSVGLYCPDARGDPEIMSNAGHPALQSIIYVAHCFNTCHCVSGRLPVDRLSTAPVFIPIGRGATIMNPRPRDSSTRVTLIPVLRESSRVMAYTYLGGLPNSRGRLSKRHSFSNPLRCRGSRPPPDKFPPTHPRGLFASLTVLCAAEPGRVSLGYACPELKYTPVPELWPRYRDPAFADDIELDQTCKEMCICPVRRNTVGVIGDRRSRRPAPPGSGGSGSSGDSSDNIAAFSSQFRDLSIRGRLGALRQAASRHGTTRQAFDAPISTFGSKNGIFRSVSNRGGLCTAGNRCERNADCQISDGSKAAGCQCLAHGLNLAQGIFSHAVCGGM